MENFNQFEPVQPLEDPKKTFFKQPLFWAMVVFPVVALGMVGVYVWVGQTESWESDEEALQDTPQERGGRMDELLSKTKQVEALIPPEWGPVEWQKEVTPDLTSWKVPGADEIKAAWYHEPSQALFFVVLGEEYYKPHDDYVRSETLYVKKGASTKKLIDFPPNSLTIEDTIAVSPLGRQVVVFGATRGTKHIIDVESGNITTFDLDSDIQFFDFNKHVAWSESGDWLAVVSNINTEGGEGKAGLYFSSTGDPSNLSLVYEPPCPVGEACEEFTDSQALTRFIDEVEIRDGVIIIFVEVNDFYSSFQKEEILIYDPSTGKVTMEESGEESIGSMTLGEQDEYFNNQRIKGIVSNYRVGAEVFWDEYKKYMTESESVCDSPDINSEYNDKLSEYGAIKECKVNADSWALMVEYNDILLCADYTGAFYSQENRHVILSTPPYTCTVQ